MSMSGAVRIVDGAPFDTRVAGLPLLLRAVLVLKQAGLSPVRVVAAEADSVRARTILSERKLADVEIVPVLPRDRPLVILPHDVLCDPAVIHALADAPGAAASARDGRRLGPERVSDDDGPARFVDVGNALVERVNGAAQVARATRALFEACRKPADGIVSRHLNRHISLFVSKRIVDTGITPNLTTLATFLIGLFAALAVSRGGYGWTLAGAALLQTNSILDGVDGELARVRHEHSRLGQWLDTLSDDLVNVAFWAGLGLGSAALPNGSLLEMTGFVAAAAQLVLSAVYWVELGAIGSGDDYAIDCWWFRPTSTPGFRARALRALLYVLKKDFFILFCFVCAVFGVLPYVLPLIAVSACAAAGTALVRGCWRLLQHVTYRITLPRSQIDAFASQTSDQ